MNARRPWSRSAAWAQLHEIQRIHLSEISPWVEKTIINYPKYIIAKDGVFGLENKLIESLSSALVQTLPPVKIPIRKRFSQRNKKVTQFVSKNPLFCGPISMIALPRSILLI